MLSFVTLGAMCSLVTLLLTFLVCTDSAYSNSESVHYHIRPSENVTVENVCPGDFCYTLAEFAADTTSYIGNETNISLFFLPGNHILDRELALYLPHADNFSLTMTKVIGGNGTVFVECVNQSGRFNITGSKSAAIKGLHFVGCGGNRVSQVELCVVEDTVFEGVAGRGTALVLNKVIAASIERSSFLSNIRIAHPTQEIRLRNQAILNYIYRRDRNPSLRVGGALYAASSNVLVFNSEFTDNTADIGGALFVYNSSLHVLGSTYSNNQAGYGGVMITSESSINIDNSTFTDNVAKVHGGVVVTYQDLFSISGSTFTNSTSSRWGGVFLAFESLFNFTCSTFSDNSANLGGVLYTSSSRSSFCIASSTFRNNRAVLWSGVLYAYDSSINITSSSFMNNVARNGGVMRTNSSSLIITSSIFTNNSAGVIGGVISTYSGSSFDITSSTFINNSATSIGGVMYVFNPRTSFIASSTFANNHAVTSSGVVYTYGSSLINITSSSFVSNRAHYGGVLRTSYTSFRITSSDFTDNSAEIGGVMNVYGSPSININNDTFVNNFAGDDGGVVYSSASLFRIVSSSFLENSAMNVGGVLFIFSGGRAYITSSTFTNNVAVNGASGVIFSAGDSSLNIIACSFNANKAKSYGGIMSTVESFTRITDCMFENNLGSLYIFSSNLTIGHNTTIVNGEEPSNKVSTDAAFTEPRPEGGAVTSLLSTVIFSGENSLSNNQARSGGAILATESKIVMYGKTTIANNTVTDSNGGGISLQQSDLEIKGDCLMSGNNATRGGGIHATSSTVAVYQPWTLEFINNTAGNGSGVYLEVNAKLHVIKSRFLNKINDEHFLRFSGNHAAYGGAIYVADDTNAGACSPDNECFIQVLTINLLPSSQNGANFKEDVLFSGNVADKQGANLFGGLLDRCIPSPFSELYLTVRTNFSGISYLSNISSITNATYDTISSLPVRVCFCDGNNEPIANCSYQPPPIRVKKGEELTVPLVAVDHLNHSIDANIISSLTLQDGGFSEGQQTQSVGGNCTNLRFSVVSPHNSETIKLFADGPCGSFTLSQRHLDIDFVNCTCPVGFQPIDSDIRCECTCDSHLSPFIINCNSTTEYLVRVNTNSWIAYINDTNTAGYVIHPQCPFDYCIPPTENISMNLNLPNGADAQCAYNRKGVLCGACQENLSLSLGSSHCIPCDSHSHVVVVVILLVATIAGILLVTALLVLDITVAVGLINGFIFYANIVAANSAVFFPSSEPSLPTVFVAWLNLDIGIDVCFFDGLDAYAKTWLQLAFPVYIISLVIILIIISEYSPKFARLIGKRDPIATLATLILLSYAKLLSVTITALSFAILEYPDGSRETVWLPDGNVRFFQGKHAALFLFALLIILVGVPYTILLFLWQWLVRTPKWKIFKWTRNTKLDAFVSVYHAPYNYKYRYWTGLLLIVRVVLYITASATVSDKPQTSLLITIFLVGGLFLVKEITGTRVYKTSFVNIVETALYFNLIALSAFSWYDFRTDIIKQTAVAYISTFITLILLIGVIVYHVYLLVKKDRPQGEEVIANEYTLAEVPAAVTHTSCVVGRTLDRYQPPEVRGAIN